MSPLIIKYNKQVDLHLFKELIKIFVRVFETQSFKMPSDNHLENLMSDPHFNIFIAQIDDQVVGGLTAYELVKYYSEESEFYIYDIAVDNNLHRQGIGKKLIQELKNYAVKKGIQCIFVQAHAEDDEAVKFYQSIFGKAESVEFFVLDL